MEIRPFFVIIRHDEPPSENSTKTAHIGSVAAASERRFSQNVVYHSSFVNSSNTRPITERLSLRPQLSAKRCSSRGSPEPSLVGRTKPTQKMPERRPPVELLQSVPCRNQRTPVGAVPAHTAVLIRPTQLSALMLSVLTQSTRRRRGFAGKTETPVRATSAALCNSAPSAFQIAFTTSI